MTLLLLTYTCHYTPQSLDYPTYANTLHMPKDYAHIHNNHGWKYENEFNDHQHEIMMKDFYKHNQDKMTPDQIREFKIKTFPYLSNDDLRLNMSNMNILRKDLDLDTDTVLSENDRYSIRDVYYSMRECLSTHDNSSVHNKSYVFVKLVNLKPFYIKPYLTHKSEIKFC